MDSFASLQLDLLSCVKSCFQHLPDATDYAKQMMCEERPGRDMTNVQTMYSSLYEEVRHGLRGSFPRMARLSFEDKLKWAAASEKQRMKMSRARRPRVPDIRWQGYANMGNLLEVRAEWKEMMKCGEIFVEEIDSVSEVGPEVDMLKGVARGILARGLARFPQRRKEAEQRFEEAFQLLAPPRSGEWNGGVQYLENKLAHAQMLSAMGLHEKALESGVKYLRVLHCFPHIQDARAKAAQGFSNLSLSYHFLGRWEDAVEACEVYLEIARASNDGNITDHSAHLKTCRATPCPVLASMK